MTTSKRVDYRTLPVGTEYRDSCGNVLVKLSSGTDRRPDPYYVTPTGRIVDAYGATRSTIITERTS